MQKMLEDLDFAIEHLPSRNNEAEAPYKVTKGAALASKAEYVCLKVLIVSITTYGLKDMTQTITLAQSADAAGKLIDSGEYSLLFLPALLSTDYNILFCRG